MKIRRFLCVSLAFALLLSTFGCAPAADADPTGTPGRVEDPFEQTTVTQSPNPSATGAPTPEPTDAPAEPSSGLSAFDMSMGFGFATVDEDIERGNDVEYVYDETTELQYRVYSGGEMRLPIKFLNITGFQDVGVGVLFFVDGVPQPYRVDGETEYSYMHTFYLERGTYYPDLYFIPVTGREGDKLEVWTQVIVGPDYVPTKDVSSIPFAYSTNAFGTGAPIIQFNADPPAQELPETANRLVSQAVSYADTTLLDIVSWSAEDLLQNISAKCTTPDIAEKTYAYRFNISEDVPIRLQFEVFGTPLVDYRLVYFLDNVPVAVAPEDLAFIEIESGRKTIVETTIDLSGFDGYSILYPVLVPLNWKLTYDGERQSLPPWCGITSPITLKLSSAADINEALEMNSARAAETS